LTTTGKEKFGGGHHRRGNNVGNLVDFVNEGQVHLGKNHEHGIDAVAKETIKYQWCHHEKDKDLCSWREREREREREGGGGVRSSSGMVEIGGGIE